MSISFPQMCKLFSVASALVGLSAAQDSTISSSLSALPTATGTAQHLGTGIYILLGVWIAFLAIFVVSARIVRARQVSLAVLLPLLVIPVIITLVLVFYPRFSTKQAELQEYARREATAATFNGYYYRDIRIALVTICGLAALVGGGVYLWDVCLNTWHPKKLHFKKAATLKQRRSGSEKKS